MTKRAPNPLEVLGISHLAVVTFKDEPEILLDIVKATHRALSRHLHPDVQPDDTNKMMEVYYNPAYTQVNDPEKLAVAVKDFLARGGEQFDKVLEITSLKTDLAASENARERLQDRIESLKTQMRASLVRRRESIRRTLPMLDTSGKLHILRAGWYLVVTKEPATDHRGYEHWHILFLDARLEVSGKEVHYQKNPEEQVKKEFNRIQSVIAQSLPFGQPLHEQFYRRGFLYGTSPVSLEAKEAAAAEGAERLTVAMSGKAVDFEDFWPKAEEISPYLEVGQFLVTVTPEIKKSQRAGTKYLFRARTHGQICWFQPLIPFAPPE